MSDQEIDISKRGETEKLQKMLDALNAHLEVLGNPHFQKHLIDASKLINQAERQVAYDIFKAMENRIDYLNYADRDKPHQQRYLTGFADAVFYLHQTVVKPYLEAFEKEDK